MDKHEAHIMTMDINLIYEDEEMEAVTEEEGKKILN